jgi:hypothetical protein
VQLSLFVPAETELGAYPVEITLTWRSHLILLSSLERENQWANATDAFALEAQPDQSQGRPPKSPGSNAHRPRTGLPNPRSLGSPCPGRRTGGADPDVSFRTDFISRRAPASARGALTPPPA